MHLRLRNENNTHYNQILKTLDTKLYQQFNKQFYNDLGVVYGYLHNYYIEGCTFNEFLDNINANYSYYYPYHCNGNFVKVNINAIKVISQYMAIDTEQSQKLLIAYFILNYIGFLFEEYVATILKESGYDILIDTSIDNDYKVDLIAIKDGIRIGIQCKSTTYIKIAQKTKEDYYNCHMKAMEDLNLKEIYYMFHNVNGEPTPLYLNSNIDSATYLIDTKSINSSANCYLIDYVTYKKDSIIYNVDNIINSLKEVVLPFKGWLW